jgi:hypothetical protein
MSRFLGFVVIMLLASTAAARPKPTKPPPTKPLATSCSIVNGPGGKNVPFERATELARGDKEAYREYAIAERGTHAGVTFYLRHGHGVVRLEAWVGGKRAGMTFFPLAQDSGDHLSLEVRDPKGGYVEAACTGPAKLHDL